MTHPTTDILAVVITVVATTILALTVLVGLATHGHPIKRKR